MGVDKVILRAFLSTLLAIVLLFSFMIAALCAFFPSTMMKITYDLGMESSCIHFAERAYKDSDDIYYIAYATEVSIEEDKTGKINSCGDEFIHHEDFEKYCEEKGGNYRQYVYGKICVAKYEKGKKAEAIEEARLSLKEGNFPKNNALVAVLITALSKEDGETVALIKTEIESIVATDTQEEKYRADTIALIEAYTNGVR